MECLDIKSSPSLMEPYQELPEEDEAEEGYADGADDEDGFIVREIAGYASVGGEEGGVNGIDGQRQGKYFHRQTFLCVCVCARVRSVSTSLSSVHLAKYRFSLAVLWLSTGG